MLAPAAPMLWPYTVMATPPAVGSAAPAKDTLVSSGACGVTDDGDVGTNGPRTPPAIAHAARK